MTLSTVSLLLRLPSYLIDHSGNNSSLIKTYLDTSWASVNQEKLDVERTPPTPLIGADEETVPLSSCLLRISGNQRLAGLWLPFHCRRCFSCFHTQTPSNTDSPRKPYLGQGPHPGVMGSWLFLQQSSWKKIYITPNELLGSRLVVQQNSWKKICPTLDEHLETRLRIQQGAWKEGVLSLR